MVPEKLDASADEQLYETTFGDRRSPLKFELSRPDVPAGVQEAGPPRYFLITIALHFPIF